MSLIVVLSGPASKRAHAQLALVEAGYPLLDERHPQAHARVNWAARLSALPSGEAPKHPQEFLTVVADDLDETVALVERFKWVLRLHYDLPAAPTPDPIAATLAEMRAEIAELKARVG